MKALLKNLGASVRARLQNLARARGEDFQLVLTRYANERLLFRLGSSKHASHFVLKGAALFTLWSGKPHRATRDVDLLGFGDPSEAHLRDVFTEIITLDVDDDGVKFDLDSLVVGPIREGQEYPGVRLELIARVTSAKVRLQIDVGFGDAVTPEASVAEFPPLLDFPAPHIRAYPRETVVAEKLEAMVQLGMANTRLKDFYDLMLLARSLDFDGEVLARAIAATFARRKTPFPQTTPVALTSVFAEDVMKNSQWSGFVRKTGATDAGSLHSALAAIHEFVAAPLLYAALSAPFTNRWRAGGPWQAAP